MTTKPPDVPDQLSGEQAIAKIRSLLAQFRSVMVVTHGTDADEGMLHVRPLALQGDAKAFGGTLWFFTDRRSEKMREIAANSRTSVIGQSDAHSSYLHLVGRAWLVDDKTKMRELYTPFVKTWFPDGFDDPNLTLLKFDAETGAYWDSPGGALQAFGAFAKAVVTRSPAKAGEMGVVDLS